MLQTAPNAAIPAGALSRSKIEARLARLRARSAPSAKDIERMLPAEKQTLYVCRRVLNPDAIIEWARQQGFVKTLAPTDLHVTVAFSKEPVDWSAVPADDEGFDLEGGGPRTVVPLGDKGAVVLKIKCDMLSKRWQQFRDAGASWDWPSYQPHITITYDGGDVDLSKVQPYDGPIEFGPERFAEVDPDAADKAKASLVTGDAEPTAAGVVLLTPDRQALFVQYGPDHPDAPGMWALPGGRLENGETAEAAARRETAEETGHSLDCEMTALGRQVAEDSDDDKRSDSYQVWLARLRAPYEPTLSPEHVAFRWAPLFSPPQPTHPGLESMLNEMTESAEGGIGGDICASDSAFLAFDRESVREKDLDGRLRVAKANISKATVNPYWGREIPDAERLGLDPNKKYMLLRDPEELRKAAHTFNGVPILRRHVPVSANDHQPGEVVGSTGTHASFEAPYLTNSLNIWAAEAIDGIESEAKRELSCGYRYRADMTPGEFDGMRFDGVMRDIVGNHVALVEDGRAGPDVVVGDAAFNESDHPRDHGKFTSGGGGGGSSSGGKKPTSENDLDDLADRQRFKEAEARMGVEKPHPKDPGSKEYQSRQALRHIANSVGIKAMMKEAKAAGNTDRAKELEGKMVAEWDAAEAAEAEHSKQNPPKKKFSWFGAKDGALTMSNRDLAKQMDTIARRQTTVGALVTYLRPRLAMDAGFSIAKVLEGIPVGPKFDKAVVVKRIRDQAKLAQDADLKDLEKVVEHVEPNEKEGTDASVSSEQHNAMQAAAHGQSSLGIPEKVGEEFVEKDKGKAFDAAGFANFLKSKGMDEATVNEAMSMLPKPTGMDESDEEKRKREEEEAAKKTAADAEAAAKEKDMVTKPAMDAAIAAATEATEKRVRENMRAVAAAQAEVRPWVGDLAPSMAFDSAPDVFRHALTMLGVEGAKTLHNDALRPVLMAQPKPGSSPRTPVLAHDAAASKGFAERFPTATRIG